MGMALRNRYIEPLPGRIQEREEELHTKELEGKDIGDKRPSPDDDVLTLQRSWFGADIVMLFLQLVLHNSAAVPLFWHLRRAARKGRTWTVRRRHIVRETVAKSAALNAMMLSALIPAVTFLAAPRLLCEHSAGPQVMFFFVWEVCLLSSSVLVQIICSHIYMPSLLFFLVCGLSVFFCKCYAVSGRRRECQREIL